MLSLIFKPNKARSNFEDDDGDDDDAFLRRIKKKKQNKKKLRVVCYSLKCLSN